MITNDGKHAKLVDFDWAAKEGDGFYPASINERLAGTELGVDVHRLGPMLRRQDILALEKLREFFFHDCVRT
jgi:hypothetical protein